MPVLVMELVEGESLAERLRRGPLPLREAMMVAQQIALALEAAHEKGILHRDLKPGNIRLGLDGRVKLLDFGLAKAVREAALDSQLVTQTAPSSGAAILGTTPYLSPEQARGQEVDRRSDIWAFGCVLFEMLTGKRAFEGATSSDTLAAILGREPDGQALPAETPPTVLRLLRRCLQKDKDQRLRDIGDARLELDLDPIAPGSGSGGDVAPAVHPESAWRKRHEWQVWALASAFGLATVVLALTVVSLRRPLAEVRPTRFQIPAPAKASEVQLAELSPYGDTVAFLATVEGQRAVWLRPLEALEARPLPGTEGAEDFVWSGDGRFIAFLVGPQLKKVPVSGGPPIAVCEAVGSVSDWSHDGTILLSHENGLIYRVPASGGIPSAVTGFEKGAEEIHEFANFLPDGRHFIYLARRQPLEQSAIHLGSLDSSESRELVAAESQATFAPPGFLLFARGRTLLAQPFDPRSLTLHGEPFAVAEGLARSPAANGDYAFFSVSQDGTLAFLQAPRTPQLIWLDRAGRPVGTVGNPRPYFHPALSPDAARLAVSSGDVWHPSAIWLFDLLRGSSQRLTPESEQNRCPVWSSDGTRIFYTSGVSEIHTKAWDRVGADEVVLSAARFPCPHDVSPDGRFLVYTTAEPKTGIDLWLLPLKGAKKPTELVRTPADEYQAQVSPDGRWLAYMTLESGKGEVYVQSLPATGTRWQVSVAGGVQPQWRRDGKELFYLAPDATLMAVELSSAGSRFVAGRPRPLFATRARTDGLTRNDYVVAPDGQHFLFAQSVEESGPPPITVVLNWAAGHKE